MNETIKAFDVASPSVVADLAEVQLVVAPGERRLLADTFEAIGVDNYHRWAWDNYTQVIEELCTHLHAKRIVEIGGGRDPLFTVEGIKRLSVEMTVNDISQVELSVLPKGYETACFDVAGDISDVAHLRGHFDLAFSRMVFEHVADGRRAWTNLHELLAPGGVALAFIPTLYAAPFVLNKLLPEKLAAAIVKILFAHRTDEEDPVFPARYSWCFTDARLSRMLSDIGYREIVVLPFYGHDYYQSFPLVRDVNAWLTEMARRNDWRTLSSHAYIAVRK